MADDHLAPAMKVAKELAVDASVGVSVCAVVDTTDGRADGLADGLADRAAPLDARKEESGNRLGRYLMDRRTRMDAQALGFATGRRRTSGLRREEVAQRALISPTWYTWLEQGRGGAPSAEVLHRIAGALMLTEVEREHLFLLGLGRAPEVKYRGAGDATPRLQRVLDALGACPALVKTATWDVVAWNRAAALVLKDYGSLPPRERNILRLMFCEPGVRRAQPDWMAAARFVVAAFRADTARAGALTEAAALVEELTQRSPEFAAIWRDNDVRTYGDGTKRLNHPLVGPLHFEYSSMTIDGRPDLAMVVFHPIGESDRERINDLMSSTATRQENVTPKGENGGMS